MFREYSDVIKIFLGSPSQVRDKLLILVEHPERDQFPKDTVVGIPITADTGDSLYVARGKWKDDEMLGRKLLDLGELQ